MSLKQLTVFVENKQGSLVAITDTLAAHNVNIRALSIADTEEFGILRLIVDDPDRLEGILREKRITASITTVISVCISDKPGGLVGLLRLLQDIQIEYMYTYISHTGSEACVILRADHEDEIIARLQAAGYHGLSGK